MMTVRADVCENLGRVLTLGSPNVRVEQKLGIWAAVADTYRLPDVAIYSDPRDLGPDAADAATLEFPKVIIEILSPSTEANDHGVKLDEYQGIDSIDTIVFVHASRDAFTTFERAGPGEWRALVHLPGQPLVLRDPAVTVTAEEIFAGTR